MVENYIYREITSSVLEALTYFPVIGILGPRQAGKSTFIKNLLPENSIYLDLENPEDAAKIIYPMVFFQQNKDHTICLDEVQYAKDIFISVKSHVDRYKKPGRFIILGSASPLLLNQSNESLAGRIAYFELMGFDWREIRQLKDFDTYWFRGGFPDSLLAKTDSMSSAWRKNYVRTFFTRDILDLSSGLSAFQLERLFIMLGHLHGQEMNLAKLSKSLDLNFRTVRKYIDMLIGTYQVFLVNAFRSNSIKRLIKSPKLYYTDTGILHQILGIQNKNDLLGHPVYGYSFEGLVIHNIISLFKEWNCSYYKTSQGAELDLILENGNQKIAIEIKASNIPSLTKGTYIAIDDIKPDLVWVITPGSDQYNLKENIKVGTLNHFIDYYKKGM